MQKVTFLLVFSFSFSVLSAQNVGIGTASPQARLHVTDSAVLFQGPATIPVSTMFDPPASGPGVRFMWYPQKAALRAGYVEGTNWDKDSIGLSSIALGYTVKAKGDYSTSMGNATIASGFASTSMGDNTTASGPYSTSLGHITIAGGYASTSMGTNTIASGEYSTSMGYASIASKNCSLSTGAYTYANGLVSTSMGAYTVASGAASTSMGSHTYAKSESSLVIGTYNDTSNTNRLFEIGIGTAEWDRVNAVTVLNNGRVGIGTVSPTSLLHVAGPILATAYTIISDARVKTAIRPISAPLDRIKKIRGVFYSYLPGNQFGMELPTGVQAGVLAQEVEQVLPQAVTTNLEGYKAVDYTKLVPLLIAGINSQTERIEALEKEVLKLKKALKKQAALAAPGH